MSKLSDRVASQLQIKIKQEEHRAAQRDQFVDSYHYLTLSHLFETKGDLEKALLVLNRFLNLGRANPTDEALVRQKQQQIKNAIHLSRQDTQRPLDIDALAAKFDLEAMASDEVEWISPDITVGSFTNNRTSSKQEKIESTEELPADPIKLVTICAAYTGKTLTDEIYELSLVAFNYCRNNDRVLNIIEQYHGLRTPIKPIPDTVKMRVANPLISNNKQLLDQAKIINLLNDAYGVISHNDSYIERQHFLCLFPKFSHLKWWSSQQDIPWSALGFKEKSLTELLGFYGITNVPRTTTERAKGIGRLLSQKESNTNSSYFKRLLSCKSMKPVEWTSELKAQSAKVQGKLFAFMYAS